MRTDVIQLAVRTLMVLISLHPLSATNTFAQDVEDEGESVYGELLIDTSIPFAEGATEEITDVRSPFVWLTYQAGVMDGWHYRFSPDGDAVFSPSPRFDEDVYRVSCMRDRGCTITGPGGSTLGIRTRKPVPPRKDENPGILLARKYVAWLFENTRSPILPESVMTEPQPGTTTVHDRKLAGQNSEAPQESPAPVLPMHRPVVQNQTPDRKGRKENKPQGRTTKAPVKTVRKAAQPSPDTREPSTGEKSRLFEITTLPPDNSPINAFIKKRTPKTSCALSFEYSIEYFDNDSGETKSGKEKTSLTCGGMAFPNLTLRGSINYYPEHNNQQPWDPDYTFSISYLYANRIGLEYSNYSGNRFPWRGSDGTGGLGTGSFRISHALPNSWNSYLDGSIPLVMNLKCAASASTSPDYKKEDGDGHWKTRLGLSCSFSPSGLERMNIVFTGLHYPISGQEQSWDPDYTLSINYKISDRLSVGYSNYSGGRWPWSNDSGVGENLSSGSLRLTYRLD